MIRQVFLDDETEQRLAMAMVHTGKSADDILESCIAEELLNFETRTLGRSKGGRHDKR